VGVGREEVEKREKISRRQSLFSRWMNGLRGQAAVKVRGRAKPGFSLSCPPWLSFKAVSSSVRLWVLSSAYF
jgi:hypothetical protein